MSTTLAPTAYDLGIRYSRPTTVRSAATAAVTIQAVDLHGWDMAFGIKMPKANAAIQQAWKDAAGDPAKSPLPLHFNGTLAWGHITYTGTGDFGAWQIAQGGSAAILKMQVPFSNGSLDDGSGQPSTPFGSGVAFISVQLAFIPRGDSDPKKGQTHDLKISTPGAKTPLPKPVTVDNVTFSDSNVDPSVGYILRPLLEAWFAANMAEFRYVFAAVSLNAIASNADWQWVKPTSTGFSYAQPDASKNPPDDACILGILCTLGGRDSSGLDLALDLAVIPQGSDAGFVISAPIYYQNNFIPHIDQSFDGASASDFAVVPSDNGSYSVTNINTVTMKIPTNKDRTSFHKAELAPKSFTATLLASEMQTRILNAKVSVSPGIDLFMDYTIHTGVELAKRSNGTQVLKMYDTQDVEQSHEVQKASWVTITEIMASLIAGCLLYGVGESGGVAARRAITGAVDAAEESILGRVVRWIVKGLIIGIPSAMVGSIAEIIEASASGEADKMPPFDPFAEEAVSTTQWSGGGIYKMNQVSFNGGLMIGLLETAD